MKIYKSFEIALKHFNINFVKEKLVKEIIQNKVYKHRFATDYVLQVNNKDVCIVEIEGGTWNHGRHTQGVGFHNDCLKYNTIACFLPLFRFTSEMVSKRPLLCAEFLSKFVKNEITIDFLNDFVRILKK